MNKLKQTLKDRRVSGEELAERVGMSGAAIRRYIRGEVTPTVDLATKIAAALEIDEGELWGVASPHGPGRTVPVYGAAQAGWGADISDISSPIDYQPAPPTVRGAGFGVLVQGDSMVPRLHPADTVFVSPGHPIKQGDLVVVQYKGKRGETLAIVKQYRSHNESHIVLDSLNPSETVKIKRSDMKDMHRVVTINVH